MDNQPNEYILKALKAANDLLDLVNDRDVLGNDNVRGMLVGVIVHCGCKLRREAERPFQAHNSNEKRGPHTKSYIKPSPFLLICTAILFLAVPALSVNATIILSTDATETLGGLTFRDGGLAEYDPTAGTATLFFNEDLFGSNQEVDALGVLDNGNIILSTNGDALLGGLSFGFGDLVEYDPITDAATLFLSANLFDTARDIDAVHILDSGNIILSTVDGGTLGGLSFNDGDLVEYNPMADLASLFFNETSFANNEDIDAAHILDNGNIILSTIGAATLGGLSFGDGDLVEYNPTTGIATLYFDESLFATNSNIDAVYVQTPEPSTIVLLGLGSLMLTPRRRKQEKHGEGIGE